MKVLQIHNSDHCSCIFTDAEFELSKHSKKGGKLDD